MRRGTLFLLPFAVLAAACQQPLAAAEPVVLAPAAARAADEGKGLKTAIFAGGCFWGVEGVFSHMRGVKSAVSGYHGGTRQDATYDRIGRGDTRHAEAVRVTYNPALVRYDELLRVYFSVIVDPTLVNRQGPDIGSQYRAALVPMDEEQRAVATAYIAQLEAARIWNRPIAVRSEPLRRFYAAEPYHQDFMLRNPEHGYIIRWDVPKVRALQRLFPRLWVRGFTRG